MDLHLIENIICIADEKSITKAAEKRFVTQSALNQQLQKLEEELGTPLFIRARGNWQLTSAGEAYVSAARQMLLLKKDAYRRIADYAEQAASCLAVGLIPERGIEMFTGIYPEFHKKYPRVTIEPTECSVTQMQRLISDGKIDLGLATLQADQMDKNEYHILSEEEIVLAVPADNALSDGGSRTCAEADDIDLARFKDMPFVRVYQASTMFAISQRIFAQAGFEPAVLFSTASNITKRRIVESGLACALLPCSYAQPGENIVYFRLNSRPKWLITMCSGKDAWLGDAAQYYLQLCRDYWRTKIADLSPIS